MYKKLYLKSLELASHKKSELYLAIVSFIESSFFPIPPDVMIVPMVMAKKEKLGIWAGTFDMPWVYRRKN